MRLKEWWCSWFHGGGDIKRDCYERINWQCRKCGRWSEPVGKQTEQLIIDADIKRSVCNGMPAYEGPLSKSQIRYTAPPKKEWVGLTHEEHMEIMTGTMTTSSRMAAVEAKLKEKNNG